MQKLRNSILFFFYLLISCNLSGQSISADLALIRGTLTQKDQFASAEHIKPFPFPGRHDPGSLVLGSAMWLYQSLISPQLSASCLYEPTCSAYSITLLKDYGIIRGMVFTADRLTRCNRIAARDFSYTRINPVTGHITETTDYYRLKKHD